VEAAATAPKRLLASGEHQMFCCGALCGKATMPVVEEMPEETEEQAEPPAPVEEAVEVEVRDPDKDGFFGPDELDDVIDRINDVVGIWGVSEETEREYIKPPVEAMNKLIKSAMTTFLSDATIDLLCALMDSELDFGIKCSKIGQYVKTQFVDPLCEALLNGLEHMFSAISWIKNQVRKVILMMSQMVTDEVVSKTVEQVGDSDIVD